MIKVGHISTVQEWFKITTKYDDHYLLSMPKSYIILNEKWEEKKPRKPGEAERWASVWIQGQLSDILNWEPSQTSYYQQDLCHIT